MDDEDTEVADLRAQARWAKQQHARLMHNPDCRDPDHIGCDKCNETEEEMHEFTADELAFIDAYCANVADAPREVVEDFMVRGDERAFYDDYSEYYTGLADAYTVWSDALAYARATK
jgi:hypothetical protein